MTTTHNIHTSEVHHDVPIETIPQGIYEPYGFKKASVGNALAYAGILTPEADNADNWSQLRQYAQEQGLPVKVTAGRTNMYVTEEGFEGLLISYRNDSSELPQLELDDNGLVTCPASVPLGHFVRTMSLEYDRKIGNLTGIPGAVGAAVLGNSGRTVSRNNVSDLVSSISTFDFASGQERTFYPSEMDEPFFGQRTSYLRRMNFRSTQCVVREVVFSLGTERDPGAKELYDIRYKEREGYQGKNHEGMGTAGSIFMNGRVPDEIKSRIPNRDPARPLLVRELLKRAVLTGTNDKLTELVVNGACFTGEHAFLQTAPETRDADVAQLFTETITALSEQYDFVPRLEIDILGPKGSLRLDEFVARHNGGIVPKPLVDIANQTF